MMGWLLARTIEGIVLCPWRVFLSSACLYEMDTSFCATLSSSMSAFLCLCLCCRIWCFVVLLSVIVLRSFLSLYIHGWTLDGDCVCGACRLCGFYD